MSTLEILATPSIRANVEQSGPCLASALDFGLLAHATDACTLRFLPPLICSSEDVNGMAERLEDAISAAC